MKLGCEMILLLLGIKLLGVLMKEGMVDNKSYFHGKPVIVSEYSIGYGFICMDFLFYLFSDQIYI